MEDHIHDESLKQNIKIYSVVVGLGMLVMFVAPCVLLAFVAKLFQKKTTPTRKSSATHKTLTIRGSIKLVEEKSEVNLPESDNSWYGPCGQVEVPAGKLEYIEQIAMLKHGMSCISTWKAYAPYTLAGTWSESSDDISGKIIAVRKSGIPASETGREKHSNCLRTEFNAIAPLPPSHSVLNLLGVCRPNPNAAPSALLFEYPLYGSLHSFLTCKRRGMISDNSNLWAGLENCSMEPNVLLAVPESSRKVLSPLLNDFDIRSRPFMAPLNEKLSHLDTLLFALQLADGMDFLDKSRVYHRHLTAERIVISTGFYLKLGGFVSSDVPAAHTNISYSRLQRAQTGRSMMRWGAPEVMLGLDLSRMSEVWRFGMILWEICSLGDFPLAHVPGRVLAESIKKGTLPPLPDHCSDELYSMMKKCWRYEPEARPTLTDILEEINELLERERYFHEKAPDVLHASNILSLVDHESLDALICSSTSSGTEPVTASPLLSALLNYTETDV